MFRADIITLQYTAVATAAIAARQLVGFDDAPAGDSGLVKGMAQTDAAVGEAVAVTMVGISDMTAGANIAVGDEVRSNAAGLPVPLGAGNNPFGRALTAAQAGERVTVAIK